MHASQLERVNVSPANALASRVDEERLAFVAAAIDFCRDLNVISRLRYAHQRRYCEMIWDLRSGTRKLLRMLDLLWRLIAHVDAAARERSFIRGLQFSYYLALHDTRHGRCRRRSAA